MTDENFSMKRSRSQLATIYAPGAFFHVRGRHGRLHRPSRRPHQGGPDGHAEEPDRRQHQRAGPQLGSSGPELSAGRRAAAGRPGARPGRPTPERRRSPATAGRSPRLPRPRRHELCAGAANLRLPALRADEGFPERRGLRDAQRYARRGMPAPAPERTVSGELGAARRRPGSLVGRVSAYLHALQSLGPRSAGHRVEQGSMPLRQPALPSRPHVTDVQQVALDLFGLQQRDRTSGGQGSDQLARARRGHRARAQPTGRSQHGACVVPRQQRILRPRRPGAGAGERRLLPALAAGTHGGSEELHRQVIRLSGGRDRRGRHREHAPGEEPFSGMAFLPPVRRNGRLDEAGQPARPCRGFGQGAAGPTRPLAQRRSHPRRLRAHAGPEPGGGNPRLRMEP